MNIFNIIKLMAEELGILTHDLPSIHNVPFWNVTQMLKSIDKNYPFVFPNYSYMLLTIGGTTVTIMVIDIFYYAKYQRVRAGSAPKKTKRKPPSKEDIEMISLQNTTNDQAIKCLDSIVSKSDPEPSTSKVTPSLIQKRLEEDYGIDFSSNERYKK